MSRELEITRIENDWAQKPRWRVACTEDSPMSRPRVLSALAATLIVACLLVAMPATAHNGEPRPIPCADLAKLRLPGTEITLAEPVTAGSLTPPVPPGAPPATPITGLPPFCRVAGVIRPTSDSEIKFETWLPLTSWNGKFNGVGNGGFAGEISYAAMADGLGRGYATASTDTGHVGNFPAALDATWALGHPEKIVDFGPRALHLTTRNGKTLVRAFYGTWPRHSYYTGCSTGGRQGLMEAQQFPADYDGLVVGAPANYWTHNISWAAWVHQARLKDPESYLPPAKLPLIANAVNARCDAKDGIVDGVLDDPRKCDFRPSSLQCRAGQDPSTCLTPKEVAALAKIYAGPRNPRTGERIFPGALPGAETGPGGWAPWITGPAPGAALLDIFSTQFFKFFVFEDPAYDVLTFNFDSDQAFTDASTSRVINAIDPNLRPLKRRGGKIILWHGWNDPAIPAENTIDYYESVISSFKGRHEGREDALTEVKEFFRLFMAPGVQHCGGGAGPAPTTLELLTVLEDWVERGKAPKRIVASRLTPAGTVDRTRPLCPYPNVARYVGNGGTDDAANFVCRSPRGQKRHRHDRDD